MRLRPPCAGDLEPLYAVFSDPEALRWWSHPPWTERAQAQAYLDAIAAGWRDGSFRQWAIVEPADDVLLGTVTLWALDPRHARCELGFMLRRDRWGRGLGTEAVAAALDHGFGALGLHRIEADVDPGNAASLRLLERLGFVREGRARERWALSDGSGRADGVLLGLLAREWRRPA
nr:GNAT family N-acetyltransferase [Coralloluteibacterium stylophorae]